MINIDKRINEIVNEDAAVKLSKDIFEYGDTLVNYYRFFDLNFEEINSRDLNETEHIVLYFSGKYTLEEINDIVISLTNRFNVIFGFNDKGDVRKTELFLYKYTKDIIYNNMEFRKDGQYLSLINVNDEFEGTELNIPFEINGNIVRELKAINNKNITKIHIPERLERLDESCFYGLTNLEEITVDQNSYFFQSIDGVLYYPNLSRLIKYPPKKKTKKFIIPEGVEVIARSAFLSSNVEELIFSSTIKEIETWGFFECTKLNSVSLNDGLKEIGDSAFQACDSLREIFLPLSLKYVGYGAFSMCDKLNIYTKQYPGFIFDNFNEHWNIDRRRVVYNYSETNNDILDFFKGNPAIDKTYLENVFKIGEYNYDKIYNVPEVSTLELEYLINNELNEDEMLLFLNSKNDKTVDYLIKHQPVYKYEKVLMKIRNDDDLSYMYLRRKDLSKEQRLNEIEYLKQTYEYPKHEFYDLVLNNDSSDLTMAKLFRNVVNLNIGYGKLQEYFNLEELEIKFNLTGDKAIKAKEMLSRTIPDEVFDKELEKLK